MMSKTAALVEARRRWGKSAVIRYNPKAMLAAEKEPLRQRLKLLRDASVPQTREERNTLVALINRDRCMVGEASALAFHVRGWGDTWEEAFTKADRK